MKMCVLFIGRKIQHHKDFNFSKFIHKFNVIYIEVSTIHGIWEVDSKINMKEYKSKKNRVNSEEEGGGRHICRANYQELFIYLQNYMLIYIQHLYTYGVSSGKGKYLKRTKGKAKQTKSQNHTDPIYGISVHERCLITIRQTILSDGETYTYLNVKKIYMYPILFDQRTYKLFKEYKEYLHCIDVENIP